MRLLVVEDFAVLRKQMAKGLREQGYAVDEAVDGQEGLWQAEAEDYDVIILDLMLPKMDGLTVLRRLRDKGKETHVLILTARDSVDDRVAGLDSGADDYLCKPFAFAELLSRVNALLRRGYQQKDPMVTVGDVRLDTAAKRVWRDHDEVELTAREYALLEYLVRRRGCVVTRTEIWTHLYEWLSDASSNVVDVYVGYLRKKLDQPGEPSLIETVRGQGYAIGRREP